MSIEPRESLEFVEESGEEIKGSAEEEERAYIASTAEVVLEYPALLTAVLEKIAQSTEAMGLLAQSDEAMGLLAQSDEAMSHLARSEVVLKHPAVRAAVLQKIAQSPVPLAKFLALLDVSKPGNAAS